MGFLTVLRGFSQNRGGERQVGPAALQPQVSQITSWSRNNKTTKSVFPKCVLALNIEMPFHSSPVPFLLHHSNPCASLVFSHRGRSKSSDADHRVFSQRHEIPSLFSQSHLFSFLKNTLVSEAKNSMYKDLKILPIGMGLDQRPVKLNVNGKCKMKSFVETERKILCKHWGFQGLFTSKE